MKIVPITVALCTCLTSGHASANDFPTQARVEYVLRCMASHGGQKYENLYSCICVIDKIAAKMAYEDYVEGEVFTQLRNTPGERSGVFRDPDRSRLLVEKLSDVSETAENACFVGAHSAASAGNTKPEQKDRE